MLSTEKSKEKSEPSKLQQALTKAGFSSLQVEADLGYFSWHPPPRSTKGPPYRYKSISKATAQEIKAFVRSDDGPDQVVQPGRLNLPLTFKSNLPKQVVVQKYPYGNIGVAAFYHAKSRCDLSTLDFFFGCSVLEILSAEKKTGKKDRAPYLVMKVPGTKTIALRYNLMFGQDYTVPGYQFERLMTGKRLEDRHDVGHTEHVQVMTIGRFKVLMSAEVDAMDANGNPSELKLMKSGCERTEIFFQMVGSGSHSLYRGRNDGGILTSVNMLKLQDLAERLPQNHDVSSLESKLIRNMERLQDWDRQGYFDGGQVYRIDFNPQMELHRVQPSLLPAAHVVKELLDIPEVSRRV